MDSKGNTDHELEVPFKYFVSFRSSLRLQRLHLKQFCSHAFLLSRFSSCIKKTISSVFIVGCYTVFRYHSPSFSASS